MSDSATATKTDDPEAHDHDEEHHVVPVKVLLATIGALMVLTVITVLAAKVDLGGSMNIILAMAIAAVKASLVCAIFMHLWWDQKINAFILFFSIFLLALFLGMAALDTGQYQDTMIPDYAEQKMKNEIQKERAAEAATGGGGEQAGGEAAGGGEQAAPIDEERAKKLVQRAQRLFNGPLAEEASWRGNPVTDAKVELGRMLYYDARLSKNQTISCNSCHQLDSFGVDGEPTSPGWDGTRGERNSPTVYNAAFQFRQFWDGREPNVEAQSKGPLTNPIEHGLATWGEAEDIIKAIPEYAPYFEAAFPEADTKITIDNMAQAIGAFERRLVTPAPFDRFLDGEHMALTADQLDGLDTFTTVGCTECHQGNLLGGTLYQKLGLHWPYESEDTGRMQVTGNTADEYMFKVPQLRNVTETGPYLHDGSVVDLAEMVRLMARHQIRNPKDPDTPYELSEDQVSDLVAFLGSLTGEVDEEYIKRPALPGEE